MTGPPPRPPRPSANSNEDLPIHRDLFENDRPFYNEPLNWLDLDKIDVKTDGSRTHVREMSPTPVSSNRPIHPLVQPEPFEPAFKTYRRRWFGLFQLILLNIVVSWDWLTFASLTTVTTEYFNVSVSAVNWLSTGFQFSFIISAPITIFTLNKGPKPAILTASILILFGNWIRYIGAHLALFPVLMTGHILIGLAQPFVLAAPTRYSDLWFTERGRTTATAIASLANPFGGALGQVLASVFVPSNDASKIPSLVLYVAIISSLASVPSLFIPAKPPTPPSPASATQKTPLSKSFSLLANNGTFYLIFLSFAILVGFFNAVSSLIAQILQPFDFSANEAGIAGGILILVGIISAIVISIVNDRVHAYVPFIKFLTPIVGASYLAFLFAPPTRTIVAPYLILAILGASSFALMPIALEYVVEVTFPVSPEVSSTLLWTAGQLLGGLFIIIMNALKDNEGLDEHSRDYPPGNMQRALLFEAIICCLTAVLPFGLGSKRLGLDGDRRRRFNLDARGESALADNPPTVNR